MSDLRASITSLPAEQEGIRAKCFHPTGTFVEFKREAIEQSIAQRFEQIARMHADRIAVKTGDRKLTYDELNQAANRVARSIRIRLGDRIEPVVLLSDHSAQTIISCLGILKAGKILLAVNPAFPAERVNYMLDDSEAAAVLAGNQNSTLTAATIKDKRWILDIDALQSGSSGENLGLGIPAAAPAQIVYTSGSTGQPKGIVRSHQSILHNVMLLINAGHICPDDRLLSLYNVSFGAGIGDILKGLLSGAAIFPFDIKSRGLSKLADTIVRQEITYYTSSPSTFRYFANGLSGEDSFPSVRMVSLGGEPLSCGEVELYRKYFSKHALLLNRLSSTETGSLCHFYMDGTKEIDTPIVPVGYPLDDKEIFIADERKKPLGFNEVGEIAVKSLYLSSEYWRNPELTNAKFSLNTSRSDDRVYFTGDLGRLLPDGCLIYLGRKDLQVKIRGYNVAVSEVEMTLVKHPEVRNAGVVAWEREGGKCLVAYIVTVHKPAPPVDELNDFLRRQLPDYMVPSAYVFMESLPLTNGKLDRTALPLPSRERPNLKQPYNPPQNAIEDELIQIWSEILGIERVGVHDNFFELGGHSLAATRIVSQVIKRFQVEVPLQALFAAPTVAEMAAVITEHQAKKLGEQDLNRILAELESLSEDEAKKLLGAQEAI